MSRKTIVALFDSRTDASETQRSLHDAGFDDTDLEIIADSGYGAGDGLGALLPRLRGWGVPDDESAIYAEGVRRGGALVVASLDDDEAVSRALDVISQGRPVDAGARAGEWRAAGWMPAQGISAQGMPPQGMPPHGATPHDATADETTADTAIPGEGDIPSPETVEAHRRLSDAATAMRDTNLRDTSREPPEPGIDVAGTHVPGAVGPGVSSPSYQPGSADDNAAERLDRTPPRDREPGARR